MPKPAIRPIAAHPIRAVFLNVPFFLNISSTFPSLALIKNLTVHGSSDRVALQLLY
jgi:hypothetical protein